MLLWWVGEDCQALKTAAAQACLLCLGRGCVGQSCAGPATTNPEVHLIACFPQLLSLLSPDLRAPLDSASSEQLRCYT